MPLHDLRPAPPRSVVLGVAACGAALGLSACTAFSSGYVAPVVVTVTPTVTVTPSAAPSTSTGAPTPPADVVSDDEGNRHDLGKIAEVRDEGGTKVITFDRYRKRGVRSARILQEGIPLEPHDQEFFVNSSPEKYDVPVRPNATFVKQTCTTPDGPADSAPSSLDELAKLPGRAAIVLLDLDDKGWVTKATSDPVCL